MREFLVVRNELSELKAAQRAIGSHGVIAYAVGVLVTKLHVGMRVERGRIVSEVRVRRSCWSSDGAA